MQITPIEIRQKRFEKSFRGYQTDEVDAFLHSLAHTWEKLLTQLSEFKGTLENYKIDVERLKNIEDALIKTMQDGETAAKHLIEQAKKESELILKEATLEASRLLSEAKSEAQFIEEQAIQAGNQLKRTIEQDLLATQTAMQETLYYKQSVIRELQRLGEELLAKTQVIANSTTPDIAEINSI